MAATTLQLNKNSQLIRNNNLFASQIDNEIVMMDDNQGLYFGLNPIASHIWSLMEKPISYQNLLTTLVNTYDVSPEQCQQDLNAFLKLLFEKNLANIVS